MELLSAPCLDTILEFEPYTRSIFAKFLPSSLSKGKLAIGSWKEIEESNEKLPVLCFLRVLMSKYLIPEFLETEAVQEILTQTVKPKGLQETDFYKSGKLILAADDPNFLKSNYTPTEGEPMLNYHEFQLILGRLGLYQPATAPERKGPAPQRIREFFTDKMGFGKGKETEGRSKSPPQREHDISKEENPEEELLVESDEYESESHIFQENYIIFC